MRPAERSAGRCRSGAAGRRARLRAVPPAAGPLYISVGVEHPGEDADAERRDGHQERRKRRVRRHRGGRRQRRLLRRALGPGAGRAGGGAGARAGGRVRRQHPLHRRRHPLRLSRRRGPARDHARPDRGGDRAERLRHLHRGPVLRRHVPRHPQPHRPRAVRDPGAPQLRDDEVAARQGRALRARSGAGRPSRWTASSSSGAA